MNTLVKNMFTGKWKSFKIFKHSGTIQLSTETSFQEFEFVCEGRLTIKRHERGRVEKVVETDQWAVETKNKKHHLLIAGGKLLYEVITVNHTVLVIADNRSGEKTFFVKEKFWKEYLATNKGIII